MCKVFGEGEELLALENKEMSDQILKTIFLCNLLLWVRNYMDGLSHSPG